MLRNNTAPFSWDRSTSFIVMASTSFTEGSGCPTETAVPRSLIAAPPRVTVPPGWLEPCSMGICGLMAAHPMTKKEIPKTSVTNFRILSMGIPLLPFKG